MNKYMFVFKTNYTKEIETFILNNNKHFGESDKKWLSMNISSLCYLKCLYTNERKFEINCREVLSIIIYTKKVENTLYEIVKVVFTEQYREMRIRENDYNDPTIIQ